MPPSAGADDVIVVDEGERQTGAWGLSGGAVAVLGACALWGLDNNLTRKVSAKDPVAIVAIKGLTAGAFSFLLALGLHSSFPPVQVHLRGALHAPAELNSLRTMGKGIFPHFPFLSTPIGRLVWL